MTTPEVAARDENDDGAGIQTFVIADVRGYTSFTHDRGDEAAAELAATFAAIARETVESKGGRLLELRGDEALSVFGSARQAIRAAVALQERFVEHTLEQPELPLRVGIGIDVGEAVPVEGGYRGGALNLAARLCSTAGPGQVLVSGETAHLARRVDGLEYVEHERLPVKGLREPVRVVRVVPTAGDPADRLRVLDVEPVPGPGSPRGRRWPLAAGAAAVAASVLVAVLVTRARSDPAPVVVPPDSVAVVDEEANRVVAAVQVGGRPAEIVVAGDSAWVANVDDSTVTRIDLETRRIVQRIGLGFEPTGVAAAEDAVWVVGGYDHKLSRIDVGDGRVRLTVGFEERIGPLREGFESGPAGVAVGEGGVWVSHGIEVTRFDPQTGEVEVTVEAGGPWTNDIAVGEGAVWVAYDTRHLTPAAQSVWSYALDVVLPSSGRRTARIPLLTAVEDLDVRDGFVWVSLPTGDTVWRIDPHPPHLDETLPAGDEPVAISVDRWLWVANQTDAVVTKIDGRTGEHLERIPVGGTLAGLATTGDELWVSVRA